MQLEFESKAYGSFLFCEIKMQAIAIAVADPELPPDSKAALIYIVVVHADHKTGIAWPSLKTLASALGKSVDTAKRAMARPELRRYLKVIRKGTNRGRSTVYAPTEYWLEEARKRKKTECMDCKKEIPIQPELNEKADEVALLSPGKGGQLYTPFPPTNVSIRGANLTKKGERICTPNKDQELKSNNDARTGESTDYHTNQFEGATEAANFACDQALEFEAQKVIRHFETNWPMSARVVQLSACVEILTSILHAGIAAGDLISGIDSYRAEVQGRSGASRGGVYRTDNWLKGGHWKRYVPASSSNVGREIENAEKRDLAAWCAKSMNAGQSVSEAICTSELKREMLKRDLVSPAVLRRVQGVRKDELEDWGFSLEETAADSVEGE